MMSDTPPYVLFRRAVDGDGTKEVVQGGFESREYAWNWYFVYHDTPRIDRINYLHGVEPESEGSEP